MTTKNPTTIHPPPFNEPVIPLASFADQVLAASQDGFFQWRAQTNDFHYSDSFSRLLGYPPGQLPLTPSSISAHIASDDLPALKLEMAKAAYHGENFVTQFRMYDQAGGLRWFRLRLTVVEKDISGRGTMFIGCVSDINSEVSERLALAERAKSEAWLGDIIRTLVRSDDVEVFNRSLNKFCDFLDIDYVVLRRAINQGETFLLSHWGHNSKIAQPHDFSPIIFRADLPYNLTTLGRGEIDFLTPEVVRSDAALPFHREMFKNGVKSVATLPFIYQNNVDHYLSLIVCGQPRQWRADDIKIAQSIGAAMSLVTSRRRITEELETNAIRLFNVLDATEDAIWDWDIANENFYVSPTFLYMLGYDEEYLPLTERKLYGLIVHPEKVQAIFKHHFNTQLKTPTLFSLHVTFKHGDGHEVTTLFRGKQIEWDAKGNPTRCVGAASYVDDAASKPEIDASVIQNSSGDSSSQSDRLINEGSINNLSGTKILLVEDNLVNQQVVKGILKRKGITVFIANNGQEAVTLLSRSQRTYCDAILMDIDMPVLDGCQATLAIRKLSNFKTIPIIAVTSQSRPEDIARCLAVGMDEHIAKPLRAELLYQSLEKLLALKKSSFN